MSSNVFNLFHWIDRTDDRPARSTRTTSSTVTVSMLVSPICGWSEQHGVILVQELQVKWSEHYDGLVLVQELQERRYLERAVGAYGVATVRL